MGLDLLGLILTSLVCGYVVVFGFVRKLNEFYYVIKLGKKQYPLPPGDMGWPLIGNMFSFLKAFKNGDPDSFIFNLVSRYGRTGMYKNHLFGKPTIIVCIPETCKKVFSDEEQFKLGYPASTQILTGRKSLHNVTNAEHKRIRRITTAPINGDDALSLYIQHIEDIVVKSLEEWSSMKQQPIEFLTELRKTTFKIITHIFMGSDSVSVLAAVNHLYIDLTHGLRSVTINLPGFAFHRALKARKELVRIFRSVMDKKRATLTDYNKDMMSLFMEIKDEDGQTLEDEDIIDLLLAFLLAGHESSSHGILWIVVYLMEHPQVFEKAKEEQEEIIKRRPGSQKGLSLKEIKQMEYLSKVINETLRRTSISFSNFREAKVDVVLNGYTIPKGWKVVVWNRAVHMDPEVHSNPKAFDPERWDNYKMKAGSFLPFGGGSRICPGKDLAKIEMSVFLHYFLLNYKLERVNPKAPVTYLPSPKPSDNCLARLIKAS